MNWLCESDKACMISSVCEWRVTATAGRAMAQAIRPRPLTAQDHVWSHASPHAICGAQSGSGTRFGRADHVSPVTITPAMLHTQLIN
jgi:hypothetical protein